MITLNKEIFMEYLNVNSNYKIIDLFIETLVITNRSFDFYVNWKKINSYFNKYKIELNILNTLINEKNFEETLKEILCKYPNVLPVIPLLLAIRKTKVPIISRFECETVRNFKLDFSERILSKEEIEEIIYFFRETGLKDFLQDLANKSIPDYYIGMEVGLDTHARKNRSGKIMEDFILSKLNEIKVKNSNSFEIITQKKYSYLKSKYGYNVTSSLKDRKADFILVKNYNKIIAIETNFYSDTGSKPQEIVNSYIQRQNELKKLGIEFIWITDGYGWKKQQNQMNFAFERLDYILNIDFIKKGLLEEIIMSI